MRQELDLVFNKPGWFKTIPNLRAFKAKSSSQEVSAIVVRLVIVNSFSAKDRDLQESQPLRQLQNG